MERILLVDNDEHLLELLMIGLEENGYTVDTAKSGLEALKLLNSESYDVLVTDLIMPNIDGKKLLRIINSHPKWSSMKKIVVSGVAAEDPEMRKSVPCDVYIAKGPLGNTIQYIVDTVEHFDRMKDISTINALGVENIYSRHITQELLEFKRANDVFLDEIQDGICRFTEEMQIIWVNSRFCVLVGTTEEELLGNSILDYMTKDSAPRFRSITTNATKPVEIDVNLISGRIVRAKFLSSHEAKLNEYAIMVSDITETLLSEEQFENIVESSNDIIWTHDFNGRITYISRSVFRITGWKPEEVIGRPAWEFIPREDYIRKSWVFSRLLKLFRDRPSEIPWVTKWRFARKDGTLRWGEVRSAPLRDHTGTVIGVHSVLADITDRHEAEQERERLLREQEALVHELHHRVNENIQLISSLVGMSTPTGFENRLSAMGEVFSELYRSNSLDSVPLDSFLRKIVEQAIVNCRFPTPVSISKTSELKDLHIRYAVPSALLIVEATTGILFSLWNSIQPAIDIAISGLSENEVEIAVTGTSSENRPVPTPHSTDCEHTRQLIDAIISQVNGSYSVDEEEDLVRFTFTFPVDDELHYT